MNRNLIIVVFVFVTALWIAGCGGGGFDVESKILQEKIYAPTVMEPPILGSNIVLYFDQSTCMMPQYRNASAVFRALRPQLGQYCDVMHLMQGGELETIALNRQDNEVAKALERVDRDIPFTDIRGVVFRICNADQHAVLITDCESWTADRRNLDLEAWMSEPFKNWLRKGYSIDMVVESYQERWQGKMWDKYRFYFFFKDDRVDSPINRFLSEINPLVQNGTCKLFKLTNSDISVKRNGKIINNNLSSKPVDLSDFDFATIDDDWKTIRQFVMGLNKFGSPISGIDPEPLIQNLFLTDGNNYNVKDMEVVAADITARYLSNDCNAAGYLGLNCPDILPNDVDISEGFRLDKAALQNRELKVFLTDKIFNHLTNGYSGNVIRLDFVITDAEMKPVDAGAFTWESLFNRGEAAICVSKSIENALRDPEVMPHRAKDRRLIHTVFIKTEPYK